MQNLNIAFIIFEPDWTMVTEAWQEANLNKHAIDHLLRQFFFIYMSNVLK